jgi:hypothetical protein
VNGRHLFCIHFQKDLDSESNPLLVVLPRQTNKQTNKIWPTTTTQPQWMQAATSSSLSSLSLSSAAAAAVAAKNLNCLEFNCVTKCAKVHQANWIPLGVSINMLVHHLCLFYILFLLLFTSSSGGVYYYTFCDTWQQYLTIRRKENLNKHRYKRNTSTFHILKAVK